MKEKWLITGVAGFIGSNLLLHLLKNGISVIGVDNFITGKQSNLDYVKKQVGKNWKNFEFKQVDLSQSIDLTAILKNVSIVVHLAALGSVPRSIDNPIISNNANITGFLNILDAARRLLLKKFIFASSSAVYGDSESLPKVETKIGSPISPYAVTKLTNEIYADVYSKAYNFPSIGLRFFNVFGPLQDPDGDYAAVIPRWIDAVINNKAMKIFGDGKTTRDFCYIDNVIEAILLASQSNLVKFESINIAYGDSNSLIDVADFIRDTFINLGYPYDKEIKFEPFRQGDIRHSLASTDKGKKLIGYNPKISCFEGLKKYVEYTLHSL